MTRKKPLFITIAIVVLLFYNSRLSYAFALPATGQITCYDVHGNIIPCDGTGQDAANILNPMSYTDNGDGTVTDNVTGLMWQQQDNKNSGNGYNWFQATGTYDKTNNPASLNVCGALNIGGHTDWRLPSVFELITIVDYGIPYPGPTINTSFFPNPNTSGSCWSSTVTTPNYTPPQAWSVWFGYGSSDDEDMTYTGCVRCVRGQRLASGNLTDNGNGTATDQDTGLTWQKEDGGLMTWTNALSYCNSLSLGGNSDWRLPNYKELASVEDFTSDSGMIVPFFPDSNGDYYSSTTDAFGTTGAWSATVYGGGEDHKSGSYYVRCVRGGPAGSSSTFSDVPSADTFASYIEAIYNAGITTGCGNGDYCPSADVTRDQMAAFLVRASQVKAGRSPVNFTCNGGANCATETPYFTDVPTTDGFFPYVQKLKELGITTGCGNSDYCPSQDVTRDQMAAFIIRALYGATFTCS